MTITVAFVSLTVLILSSSAKWRTNNWWKANLMKNAPERRGPTAAEHWGGCPTPELHGGWSIQKFIAAEQQHQKVEDGATTHQEKGGEVYLGSEIHKAAQNFEKNEKKNARRIGKKRKTENFKLLDLAVNSCWNMLEKLSKTRSRQTLQNRSNTENKCFLWLFGIIWC